MCNLYRLDVPANQIADAFGIDAGSDPWAGDYVAPGKYAPVVVRADGQKVMVPRVWGVPPPPNGDRPVTNVRNLDSPFWIGTLRHTMFRCLIPVTSFQEWGGERGRRTQHWFSVPSEPVFAIAGIWRDSEVASFAMLTTDPNPLVEAVHPKAMPVILGSSLEADRWLSAYGAGAAVMQRPYPDEAMIEVDIAEPPPAQPSLF